MNTIRALIVDDHELVAEGLCRLLDAEPDIEVVGTTGSGREAVSLCASAQPDVVLLDYGLPDLDGLEATRRIMSLGAGVHVLILTMHSNEEYATRLFQAGASGFVVKAAPSSELLDGIRKVADGGIFVSQQVQEKMLMRIWNPSVEAPESVLSNREMQVLTHLARGSSSREVASALSIAVSTVETHRSRVMEKLSLRNNSDLTRFALRRGLIGLE